MSIRLNFYSKVAKHLNEFHETQDYIDKTNQLIYFNEIRKELVVKLIKFNFSQEELKDIDKMIADCNNSALSFYYGDDMKKAKIQEYADANKGKYECIDVYLKFEEEYGNVIYNIVSEDILIDIAKIDL